MLRLGRIDYINADPLFEGVPPAGVDARVIRAVPSALNAMMRSGQLDVSLISSIEYARAAPDYRLIAGAGIAARGPIRSVLLLSPWPIEQLAGRTILLSSESATTVVLLKVLMRHRFRVEAHYESWDLARGLPAGPVMLIGDPALTAAERPSHPHVYDLCEEWVRFTGLPMTFAVACARAEALERLPADVEAVSSALLRAARQWPRALDSVVDTAVARIRLPLPVVRAYLLALEYRLTKEHRAGLARFFELAAGLGEIPGGPPLWEEALLTQEA